MGKLIVTEFITLDGIIDDPGGSEGHPHGGWSFRFPAPDGGERQISRGPYGPWDTLPFRVDGDSKRGTDGVQPLHATLVFDLRTVDHHLYTRVKLTYLWKTEAGAPGSAGDTVRAPQREYTRACRIP